MNLETDEEKRIRLAKEKSNLKAQKVLGIVPKSATKPVSKKALELLGGGMKKRLMDLDELDLENLPETTVKKLVITKVKPVPVKVAKPKLRGSGAKKLLMDLDELDLENLETDEEKRIRLAKQKSQLKAQKVLGIVPKSATKPVSKKALELLGGGMKKRLLLI